MALDEKTVFTDSKDFTLSTIREMYAEVDHIVPFSQGGKTDISNAQLLHRHCNREKSDSLELLEQDFEDDSE
jgi:5-methylcytosine-specific restriction endonuclease McrA